MRCLQITLITLLIALTAHAQTESVRTIYDEETARTDTNTQRSGSRFLKVYRKFIRAQVEEKTLIKITATPILGYAGYVGTRSGFRSKLAVERKLIPAVSIQGALATVYSQVSRISEEVSVNGLLNLRWYYAQNNRIRKGKSANNFSNQYVMFMANQSLFNQARLKTTGERYSRVMTSEIGIGWGVQRRLGRFGYFDYSIGPGVTTTQKPRFTVVGTLEIGIGF
ncbi:hypothetical protein [Spirosoma arcticum]